MFRYIAGLLTGVILAATAALLAYSYARLPDIGADALVALLGAIVGGAVGIAGTAVVEHGKRRSTQRAFAALVAKELIEVAISLALLHSGIKIALDAGQPAVDPADPLISSQHDALLKSKDRLLQLAERGGEWLPRALKDLLLIDTDLILTARSVSVATPCEAALAQIDKASASLRGIDKQVAQYF